MATKVHDLARELMSHVGEEERELLPQLRTQIAPEAFTEMAAAAEAARAGAPTRLPIPTRRPADRDSGHRAPGT